MQALTETSERFLTIRELSELLTYSEFHIRRLEAAGKFPKRIQIGPARVVWRWSDISAWIAEREKATPVRKFKASTSGNTKPDQAA